MPWPLLPPVDESACCTVCTIAWSTTTRRERRRTAGPRGTVPSRLGPFYKAALEKVTLDDLSTVAKKYVHPDKLAVLVVGNGPEIKPGVDELGMGPVHPIDITIPQPKQAPGQENKQ